MKVAPLLLPLVLAGCATSVRLPADSGTKFDPIAFFTGRSQGQGTLRQPFSPARQLQVDSFGRPDGRGGLILSQVIRQEGKQPRTRTWTIRPAGPNLYTGTLTDAVGPVTVTTRGPRAQVRYEMRDGLEVEQQLALQADGKTLLNRLEVRKWGVRVARVEETIRKDP